MRLGVLIFLGYFLIVLLAGFAVFNVFVDEIKPSARQAMEDSLLDTANLLAELAVEDMIEGRLESGPFIKHVAAYQARDFGASIWGFVRSKPGLRIYITNIQGIVVYDSAGEAKGEHFSRWNDVYLTLKGQYGVRSSPDRKDSPDASTTMFVAAPMKQDQNLVGVLTVAKSNQAVEPFIARTKNKIIHAGYWLLAAALLIGILMSLGLSLSMQKLVTYAEAVTRGERAVLPPVALKEVRRLGHALHTMRERLEGKRYVEEYVWTLTHEMKSPLTAIQASSELLQEDMPEAQRQKFLSAISEQTKRIHILIEKMLRQASLDYKQALDAPLILNVADLIRLSVDAVGAKLRSKRLELQMNLPADAQVLGDSFLLEQAFINVLDNAIDFSPAGGILHLQLARDPNQKSWRLLLRDQGPGIPPFALPRVFERYYSLPRSEGGPKSTGLGLTFVEQVMILHGGHIELVNHPEGGAELRMDLPTQN